VRASWHRLIFLSLVVTMFVADTRSAASDAVVDHKPFMTVRVTGGFAPQDIRFKIANDGRYIVELAQQSLRSGALSDEVVERFKRACESTRRLGDDYTADSEAADARYYSLEYDGRIIRWSGSYRRLPDALKSLQRLIDQTLSENATARNVPVAKP
jgi:hypothetical protein